MNPDPGRKEPRGHPTGGRRDGIWLAARDIGSAGLAVAIVIGSIFAYSGTWPPMVVIESGSMQHDRERSMIGVIDTGDLTLVKKVDRDADIITYMQGVGTGYRTYGSFGDVLIYAKNGFRDITPIIHRAVTRIAVNASGASYDFPELQIPNKWNIPLNETNFALGPFWEWDDAHPGGAEVNYTVDLKRITDSMAGGPLHGGFITKGDQNQFIDQGRLTVGAQGHFGELVEPVEFGWVVGKAVGELPWFGVIKLVVGGARCPPNCIPGNSSWNLVFAIVAIAVGPYAVETLWRRYGDRVTRRIPPKWRDGWHRRWDGLPGGVKRAERRKEREAEIAEERRRRGGRRHGGRAR